MLNAKEQQLLDALESCAQTKDVEIVTVEIVGARRSPTVRVFIDTEAGVSFDVLSSAQVWIDKVIDDLDLFVGAYTLEVSSPGIDRPLRTVEHFKRFIGESAVVKTTVPLEGQRSFSGVIVEVKEDAVVLDCEGSLKTLAFELIKRAHLKGVVDFNG